MIKSYEPCIINKNDTLNQLIQKNKLIKKMTDIIQSVYISKIIKFLAFYH